MMRIGVLAVQGAFAEHTAKLKELGAEAFEIRQLKDISENIDGLILPGGESTVMKKLLRELKLYEPIKEMICGGIPVFGTCAGMILLAKGIDNGEEPCFGTMDIVVKRNAYGKQLGSFNCIDSFAGHNIEMPFIRAPYVVSVGKNTEILSMHDGKITAVKQDNMLAAAFHPELTDDTAVFNCFFEIIRSVNKKQRLV